MIYYKYTILRYIILDFPDTYDEMEPEAKGYEP